MIEKQTACDCHSKPVLIFSCSGGSDAGELADRSARTLGRSGVGKMYCLAGIGGKVETMMENTRQASKILVIDGCPQQCAKKTMEQAGIEGFQSLGLFSLGFAKGKAPATDENIQIVVQKAKSLLS